MSKVTSTINIPQPSIAGRIGTGIGKGLAEQLPEEITRGRLSHGLNQVANQQGLTPFQQFSQLASTPGITPQMLQSGAELLKQQGLRQSFRNQAGGQPGQIPGQGMPSQPMQPLPGFNIPSRQGSVAQPQGQQGANANLPVDNVQQATESLPGRSELSPELVPAAPWTQDRWVNEIANAQDQFPNMTNDELKSYVANKEQRELAAPEAQRGIDAYKESIQDKAYDQFDKLLSKKLQKEGASAFADVPGDLQNKLKRGMVNDLINNRDLTVRDAAEKWSELGHRRAKAVNDIDVASSKGFFSQTPENVLSNLNSYSSIFKDIGDSENYKNMLISKFNFTPQRAAQVAFHPSKPADGFIKSLGRTPGTVQEMTKESVRRANTLPKHITPSDSIQSIVSHIKNKDPYFDEQTFFQELKQQIEEDPQNSPYTLRQREEISSGAADMFPSWADLYYFPLRTGVGHGPMNKKGATK